MLYALVLSNVGDNTPQVLAVIVQHGVPGRQDDGIGQVTAVLGRIFYHVFLHD
jgi:hypothetical protein